MTDQLSFVEWFIADHQLKAQILVIESQIARLKLEMGADAPQITWTFIHGLEEVLLGLKKGQREVRVLQPQRGKLLRRLLDALLIKLYLWSMAGRITIERED